MTISSDVVGTAVTVDLAPESRFAVTLRSLIQRELRGSIQRPITLLDRVALAPLPQEESEDVLIPDPRGELTPSQIVDQKLLALLRGGNPGLYLQAAGNPQDVRRIPDQIGKTPDSMLPDATDE